MGIMVNTMFSQRENLNNKTRLSWWFPRLPSDIFVPQTLIFSYPNDDLIYLCEGKIPHGFRELCSSLIDAGHQFGWPIFLRTDYLSGKHNWKNTCYVRCPQEIPGHIASLVEDSVMADICGFPTDRWIVRKLILTRAAFSAFRGDMPIVKERRYFVQDAKVMCHHPYWPPEVFNDQRVSVSNWQELLEEMNNESDEEVCLLSKLSSKVGAAIGGALSIDWLWSEQRGRWFLIDMAEAAMSYHWPGCPNIGKV